MKFLIKKQLFMKRKIFIAMWSIMLIVLIQPGCKKATPEYYSQKDFYKVPKTDVHFHYNSPDSSYLLFADSLQFRIVSPNVDAGRSLEEQLEVSKKLQHQFPRLIAFLGTFPVDDYGTPGFSDRIITRIKDEMQAGAAGIKIWKNIGMVLKDSTGKYVMADDYAFKPVFEYLQENNIPLMAHLGEPLNCWLPLEKMTLDNDRSYFKEHPEYHMYLHPEAPSYQDQINSRDSLLQHYPGIRFTGAHLASLEWSVDELAKRLDRYPNLNVDMSARIGHLQYQSITDYDKVRNFMIRYKDRIMYGTDGSVSGRNNNYSKVTERMKKGWMDHWVFLATDSVIIVDDLGGKQVKGLRLPAEVIESIYQKNADKFFRE
jgi:predicted TIM-barrel fold metal-dependent hydrolase